MCIRFEPALKSRAAILFCLLRSSCLRWQLPAGAVRCQTGQSGASSQSLGKGSCQLTGQPCAGAASLPLAPCARIAVMPLALRSIAPLPPPLRLCAASPSLSRAQPGGSLMFFIRPLRPARPSLFSAPSALLPAILKVETAVCGRLRLLRRTSFAGLPAPAAAGQGGPRTRPPGPASARKPSAQGRVSFSPTRHGGGGSGNGIGSGSRSGTPLRSEVCREPANGAASYPQNSHP